MLTDNSKRSHTRGNELVPSRWQATVTAEPHAPMTMDRSAPGPPVGRLSGRSDAQQPEVTPTY
jgi:hypothetical protein